MSHAGGDVCTDETERVCAIAHEGAQAGIECGRVGMEKPREDSAFGPGPGGELRRLGVECVRNSSIRVRFSERASMTIRASCGTC